MIRKETEYTYTKNKLTTRTTIRLFGIRIYNKTTISTCPCDLEAVERQQNKNNNNGKIGFKN